MKKIAIITLVGSNFGNRLQNFAVCKYFEKMGYETVTLNINNRRGGYIYYIHGIFRVFYYLGNDVYGILKKINKEGLISLKRELRFIKFTHRMIPTRCVPFWNARIQKKYDREFDYFAVGSDQIWNVMFGYGTKVEMLDFTEPNKKICVCPSIGMDEYSKQLPADFCQGIMKFPKLSVREETGAKIIKDLTGRRAEVLLDPTFMLDAEEWKQCAKKPKKIDFSQKYILSYFLGEKSSETSEKIQRLSEEHGWKIYELLNPKCKELYLVDPFEFLYLIMHASYVCTNSFHAAVFSIILQIPFTPFKRIGKYGNMGDRIENLLNKLQLSAIEPDNLYTDIVIRDYSKTKEIIELEKNRFDHFIKSSMESEAYLQDA